MTTMHSSISAIPLTVILALALTACGGGESTKASPPTETVTVSPSAVESSAVPEGESDGCLVAANKWTDRMTDHVLDAATTAPAFAEMLDLGDLDDPISEVKALCSDALAKPILRAYSKITVINFELSLCGFSDSCDPTQTRKVRKLADQAASMVGDVRQLL